MSSERWADLSELYVNYYQTAKNDHLRAAVMAKTLRAQLAAYLGGESDSVLMFDYDEETHAYVEESNNPFKAVSMNGEYKWFLGYGVTLDCEKIYQGIRESLIARATKTLRNKTIGFVEFGPDRA